MVAYWKIWYAYVHQTNRIDQMICNFIHSHLAYKMAYSTLQNELHLLECVIIVFYDF